jgi:hypothetical protein
MYTTEVESLTSQIITALHKIKEVLIVVTSRFTDNQIQFSALSKIIEIRAKNESHHKKKNLGVEC